MTRLLSLLQNAPDGAPLVMGVLNVTPDSFSDGGRFHDKDNAIRRAIEMIDEGAAIVDVGAESTRPGAEPVPADMQIRRAVPVIDAIRARNDRVAISVDTRLASVARVAIRAGADIVNDVSALRDDEDMMACVAECGAAVVLMHMRGRPREMQAGGGPRYDDLLSEIEQFLIERRAAALAHGITKDRILFDPGLGFGKRYEHNLHILRELGRIVQLGQPVVVGASRKSFIGRATGCPDVGGRLPGSLACAAISALAGVRVIRAHDVRATIETLHMLAAIRGVAECFPA